ncbi:hypothetical protein [Pedobacter endophyticus]|uniref:Uncharacterized protein n=1 Tax=Pedobacter endophyticus TaxID=2789740 RepID=A0A7U3Q5F8_9SPHI|nr:hypothetical protein [Pedobacter endophyticus]QPH38922.1 hypothetical protein IZT61_17925 [Pedobacter endophyticus]
MIRTSIIICCSILLLISNSCKKNSDEEKLSNRRVDIITSAKELYESNVKEGLAGPFAIDWNKFYFQGDSLLVVKMAGHSSIGHQEDDIAMVSGVIFTTKKNKITRVQKVEFIGKKSDVQLSSLKILTSFNDAKIGKPITTDGTFIQYSVKHNKYVAAFLVHKGTLKKGQYIASRRIQNPNLRFNEKSAITNGSGKLMDGGSHNPACDAVYLFVWETYTGRLISQTWLYDTCDEEDGAEPPTGEPQQEEELDCKDAQDALSVDIAGENSLIEPEPGTETGATRNYIYQWMFLRNSFGLYTWKSTERGYHKKVGDEWQWDRLEHLSVGMDGMTPGAEVTINNFILQPTLGKYYSIAKAYFNYKAKPICDTKLNPIPAVSMNLTAVCEVWYVNDIF